jgi:hypothetical protein
MRRACKKWYQLQLMIYLKLLTIPDDSFNKLLAFSKNDRIKQLFKDFNLLNNPNKNKLRVILEEIPFISKNHIKKFLNDFIIYYKYDLL